MKKNFFCLTIFLFIFSYYSVAHAELVPVKGFARSFLFGTPIPHASITILETGEHLQTDSQGNFQLNYPAGNFLTLELKKWNYKTTQTATIRVPREGLTQPENNISFQVPYLPIFYLFSLILNAHLESNACHLTATVSGYHKTLDDLPQGEAGVKVSVDPGIPAIPFYFGIFHSGVFKDYTNPFIRHLTSTTEDGGIAFINLPSRSTPYTLLSQKAGKELSKVQFLCRKGSFINISPPNGPKVVS